MSPRSFGDHLVQHFITAAGIRLYDVEGTLLSATPFQAALQTAMRSEEKLGRIRKAMEPLGNDFKITSPEDAEALADAIGAGAASNPPISFVSPFAELVNLLQSVGSKEAFEILRAKAMPPLEAYFDHQVAKDPKRGKDLALLLRPFVQFRRREGFERVVQAIRSNLDCGWLWTAIFRNFRAGHPFLGELLQIPLCDYPKGFIRVALLDQVNHLAIEGNSIQHPIDSQEGKDQLREWLTPPDQDHGSYAHSATAALPFISKPEQTELLALAMDHISSHVQLEAAWAAAKIGNPGGITVLSRACSDPATFVRAAHYLEELGRSDAIPEKCRDPDFAAEAQARSWLEHPNECGRQPDQIKLFDSRTLFWPPANETRRVHLFRYTYREEDLAKPDETGMVMTGGCTTFALFSETTAEMSAEDVYAIHCCWELQLNHDPRAPKERTAAAGRALLGFDHK